MFVARLISGIILIVIAALVFFFGNIWLAVVSAILALIGSFELLRVFGMEKHPLAYVVYLGTIGYYTLLYLNMGQWLPGVLALMLLASLVIYVLKYPEFKIQKVTQAMFVFIYVGLLLSFVFQTRELPGGQWFVWLIFIGSWGSDTCAYVVGKLFGKHHFSELSPKKTMEGCIGGVVGAGLIGLIYSCFFPYYEMFIFSPKIVFPIIVMIAAVISQFGDFAASAIKRNYDTKDYGTLIPGHGGVLDRFDSVIFVAPFVYYLLVVTSYIRG